MSDTIYLSFIQSQADTLYAQVSAQAVLEQLIAGGYDQLQAEAYLQTTEGQAMITQTVSAMTDAQKEQIIEMAIVNLTSEQKEEIKASALTSLTEEQKDKIRNGYIEQLMKSKEVTDKITAAVSTANDAATNVASLKGQLDNYGVFYQGLKSYTSAVSEATDGANKLKINMDTLSENTSLF